MTRDHALKNLFTGSLPSRLCAAVGADALENFFGRGAELRKGATDWRYACMVR